MNNPISRLKSGKGIALYRTLLLYGIFSLSGCTYGAGEKYSTSLLPDSIVPAEHILDSFEAMYPGARDIVWSIQDDYYVVDFMNESEQTNAWFDSPGDWLLSKSYISFERLSGDISSTFRNSTYADWNISAVCRLERKTFETIYLIHLESEQKNTNLYFSELGHQIRVIPDAAGHVDSPVILPEKAKEVIDDLFGQVSFIDSWYDFLGMIICIKEKETYKNVVLDSYHEWICTIWDIKEEAVPEIVMNSFKSSEYGKYKVEYYQITENITEIAYVFHFKAEGKNYLLTIKESGLFKSLVSY
jgi:hypothetical protein